MWVGSLPTHAQWCRWKKEQRLNSHEEPEPEDPDHSGNVHFPLCKLLEARLTEIAMQLPGHDIDAGPPVKRVTVHPSYKYAFVEVDGPNEWAEQLIKAFNGSLFFGKHLRVRWERCSSGATEQPSIQIPPGLASLLSDVQQDADPTMKGKLIRQIAVDASGADDTNPSNPGPQQSVAEVNVSSDQASMESERCSDSLLVPFHCSGCHE
eukprot:TRINITY_DN813_c0_g3_i2.p1 TRINITY_DN813_c0_g3~~TRINITY_DN813_c0_g3_i2.p1  ORF type:complete len:208 (-),score=33.22 TRINITY_DN813_c0_g3_i2:386-1009(-)